MDWHLLRSIRSFHTSCAVLPVSFHHLGTLIFSTIRHPLIPWLFFSQAAQCLQSGRLVSLFMRHLSLVYRKLQLKVICAKPWSL